MQSLRWERRPDGLRAPALVAAFEGWNDAGDAASSALTFIAGALGAEQFASLDPEDFYDFKDVRPTIRFVDGVSRAVDWPDVKISAVSPPGAVRDLILVTGHEPSFRWRRFCDELLDLAEALGVQSVVTLGSLLADVPHTRPTTITGLASDDALVERVGLTQSSYEGPTGITGVLHDACQRRGLPSVSLWAAVPHYVAVSPNPKGALALVRKLEGVVGVAVDATELEQAAGDYERQVNRAVESDPDVQAFVERLERAAAEEEEDLPPEDLPSGDVLASEFQRFLRQRGGRGPGPG